VASRPSKTAPDIYNICHLQVHIHKKPLCRRSNKQSSDSKTLVQSIMRNTTFRGISQHLGSTSHTFTFAFRPHIGERSFNSCTKSILLIQNKYIYHLSRSNFGFAIGEGQQRRFQKRAMALAPIYASIQVHSPFAQGDLPGHGSLCTGTLE
jgi:hypothetical protein